jgi:DNA polymerase III alpha subunit
MGGFYPTFEYVEEARRMGLRILLPDVNRSRVAYTTEFDPDRHRGEPPPDPPKHNCIRIGLMQVRGLPDATARAIVEERERGGLYTSLTDFLKRVPSGRRRRKP